MNQAKNMYLFCPGPVHVPKSVRIKVANTEIGHREKEFEEVMSGINRELLSLLEIRNKVKYFGVPITGSSSAANEAVLSAIAGQKRVLVVVNGEFGNRLYTIARKHSHQVYALEYNWGSPIDVNEVERLVKRHRIDIVCVVHHETSTGMLNPIDKIGAITKKYNAFFFVDAVSSVGAEVIDMEKWNISFLTGATGKAIGAFPGSSFVVGTHVAFESLKDHDPPIMYLNIYNFYRYSKEKSQTPNTPSVQSFVAFYEALKLLNKKGIMKQNKIIAERAIYLRKAFVSIGLRSLLKPEEMSVVLTTLYLPEGFSWVELQKKLREKCIIVYGGKGPLENKFFQVANIGELTQSDLHYFVNSLATIVRK